jgi:heat shock protein HtpX
MWKPGQGAIGNIMKDKLKIYLVFIVLSLVIFTISAAADYFLLESQGTIYVVAAGLIISGIVTGSLYYLPSFIMVKLYDGKELLKDDSPEFMETIEEFAEIVDIPVPKFYLSDKDIPLIFTVGRDCNSASIVLTHKLMNILSSEELTCAIIHEMSHIKLNQIHWQTLVAFIVGILTMFSTIFFWGVLLAGFGQEDDPVPRIIKFISMALFAPPAASLILLTIPANREYIIDKTAVEICKGPKIYVRMLAKIGRHFNETRHECINPAHGLLNIVNPLPQSKDIEDYFYALFKTHPGLDERIETVQTEWMAGWQGESIIRWKKTLLYSIFSHSMILFGIILVYTFYNKDFRAVDSIIITGAYLGLLVTTHSMMYLIFKNKLR